MFSSETEEKKNSIRLSAPKVKLPTGILPELIRQKSEILIWIQKDFVSIAVKKTNKGKLHKGK